MRDFSALSGRLEDLVKDEEEEESYYTKLFPGRMNEVELYFCPKTYVFTSEYDYLRNDTLKIIEELKRAGVYQDHQDMPGVHHGYQFSRNSPESTKYFEEFKEAFKGCLEDQ